MASCESLPTIAALIKEASQKVSQQGSCSARIDVELLLAKSLNKPRTYLYAHPEVLVTASTYANFLLLLEQRLQGVPVAYLVGKQAFWSLDFFVTEDVLIPRPETELLVEYALEQFAQDQQPLRVVDAGTGSGAIAVALASEARHWQIIACDYSMAALRVAQKNIAAHHVETNIALLNTNWLAGLANHSVDLIISNPPYIDKSDAWLQQGDVRFEPNTALIAKQHGMADINALISQARSILKPNGCLLIEHGYQQAQMVRQQLSAAAYQGIHSCKDLSGHERITVGKYTNDAQVAGKGA